jgi:hypothetical protein
MTRPIAGSVRIRASGSGCRNHKRRVIALLSSTRMRNSQNPGTVFVPEPFPYCFFTESPSFRPISNRIMLFRKCPDRGRVRVDAKPDLFNHRRTSWTEADSDSEKSMSTEILRTRRASDWRASRMRSCSAPLRKVSPSSYVQILNRLTRDKRASLLWDIQRAVRRDRNSVINSDCRSQVARRKDGRIK